MLEATNSDVRIFSELESLSRAAAEAIVSLMDSTLHRKDRFAMALSGGHTPRRLYQLLAEEYGERISWSRVHLFWGDERYVPPSDPRSNYGLAQQELIARIRIPRENVHPIPTSFADPEDAARAYEQMLREYFRNPWPDFNVVLLGLGPDGHTASLFPGSPAVSEQSRWVAVGGAPVDPHLRLTLTLPVLNHAAHVYFLASGADKAEPLRRALATPPDPISCPASAVRPIEGSIVWWVDRNAGALIAQPTVRP